MNQEEQIKNSAEAPEMKEQPKESEEVKTLGSAAEDGIVDKIVARFSSIFSGAKFVPTDDGARPDPEPSPKKDSEVESATLGTKAEAAPERKEPEPAKLGAEGEGNLLDPHRINLKASVEATKTLHQFLASPEGKAKFNGAARLLAVSPSEVARPEHTAKLEAAREFVNIVKSDEGFMAFMGNINVLNANGRYEKLSTLVERAVVKLASGANSIDFVTSTPDLAVVEWLSLFYRQLLPANSWADRCARMSGSDKQGIIWVESAMKPKIYFGDRAPLNVADYLYDDDPVGLVTKVFSLQPVLWQAANTDILAYDDRSWGQSEAVRFMVNAIHNFALQKIAETAGGKVEMSGLAPDGTTVRTFDAKDAFPINSAATGTLHQMSPKDLTRAQSQFINWNYDITEGSLDLVMDAAYYEQLFSDPYLTSLLTKTAGSMRPMLGQYSAFNFMARSTTAAYDTASSKVVDAELYCDGKVSADGTIPTYTPPVLAATAYGMGIGFIPSQVILAMGNVNMYAVPDPNSYGWKFSMDMRFGAGAARKGGKGIVNFVPKVYTAPSGD